MGTTPVEVVYGRKPPVLSRFLPCEVRVEAVRRELLDWDEAIKQLKYHLQRAQNRMKDQADRKRIDRQFEVGEWVFLKLHPHGQSTVGARINPPRYYGLLRYCRGLGLYLINYSSVVNSGLWKIARS